MHGSSLVDEPPPRSGASTFSDDVLEIDEGVEETDQSTPPSSSQVGLDLVARVLTTPMAKTFSDIDKILRRDLSMASKLRREIAL